MPGPSRWKAPLFVSVVSLSALAAGACGGGGAGVAPVKPPPPAAVSTDPKTAILPVSGDLREGSALVLGRIDGRAVAFVADEDEDAVHTLDVDAGTEIARTPVAGRPTQLLLVDGKLAVARRDAASVVILGADAADAPLRPVRSFATADEPVALAVDAGRSTLWVASGWGRRLEGLSLATGQPQASIALGREPRAVLVADDGKHAYVGYASDSKVDVVDLAAAVVDSLSLDVEPESKMVGGGPCGSFKSFKGKMMAPSKPCVQHFDIPRRFGRQTYALARVVGMQSNEEQILAPYVLVTPGEPQVVSSGYGGSFSPKAPTHTTFDVATVAGESLTRQKPFRRFDDCALPRGVAFDELSDHLFVACMGSNRVAAFHPNGDRDSDADVIVPSPGGPFAVALDLERHRLVVATLFDRSLTTYQLFPGEGQTYAVKSTTLSHENGQGLSADAAEGRRLFHVAVDPAISGDGRACATCHPDGRDDGLVWPTPNGPRQTIFLAGRLTRGAPFGWDAEHTSIPEHMKVTLKNLGGSGLDDDELTKIATWLAAMPPPPRNVHALSAEEQQGRMLFASGKTGCSSCHMGTELTDDAAHDVLSKTPADAKPAFLAPSLKFIGGSAPYFHDGRYGSLVELIQQCDGKMGVTKDLGPDDVAALEAYLRTL